MKVLLLSPYPQNIVPVILDTHDAVVLPFEGEYPQADFLISFGHPKVLSRDTLLSYPVAINIHIGMLPWNKGAHPNFWSWFDNTPKGVTIHHMDEGIDTGAVIFQTEIRQFLIKDMTLKSTYNELVITAERMFKWCWPSIRRGKGHKITQTAKGSYHTKAETQPWLEKLSKGWDTPVSEVERMGREHRTLSSFTNAIAEP